MEITEEQYARIKDSLPVQRGNVSLTNLQVLNAILYVAEQGCKWRGLPKRFGRWHTIYMRMNRWAKNGVLDRDEQRRLPDQTGGAFVNGNRGTRPIDEQLLARLVLLPEHDIELASPLLIVVAEVAVAITIGMRLSVFHPEELQRQVPVLPELIVNRREIRRRSRRCWL